jgi:hypothetical protein
MILGYHQPAKLATFFQPTTQVVGKGDGMEAELAKPAT